ncbi:MAG TPA: Stk1 family PASTA domain-containing Ser/Thr kinase [Micromonosporaceae bacterium]|nr:Stk1 family PASTA domain-containing Ser/Thr kinase [Micromonosporaceae bacterium]
MTTGGLLGGRYQVGELLGYGGMAEVHLGRDQRLGRDVAIKTLRADLARDATFQMRFRREAQNAAALNHPAIVAVYDTGEEHAPGGEELPYIVMEFVNGRTLKEVLAAEGRLMPRRALEITADICAAIEFSHRHGIIHRDIKPGNVMLTQTGQVKVMDFGIARAMAGGASTMTQTSAVIGTAQYLSPEQARGEAVDARSDVYATGCVLYELLCGHPPFVGDNPVSVAYQHVREDPRPPSNSNPDVSPEIDAVVLKALAKNPLNRYQSAAEMRTDVLRAAAGRPVSAPPVLTEEQMTAIMAPQSSRPIPPPSAQVARVAQRQRQGSKAVVAGLVLLGLMAVAAVAVGLWAAQTREVPVPNLVNQSATEADALLRTNKLEGKRVDENKIGCTLNAVIGQDPAPGANIPEGGTVEYTVCLGPESTNVPNLVGLSRAAAQTNLTNANLVPVVEAVDNDKPLDEVIRVEPAENTPVPEGSTVKVIVSKGNMKPLPDLRGRTLDEARKALRDAGFTAQPKVGEAANDDPEQSGKVTFQNPQAATVAKLDAVVTINIAKVVAVSPPPPPPTTPPPTATTSPSPGV